ncbi:MAG: hypothetical protein HDQ87_01235 [Clostridia bacterium]|nr:hypothetical protein [Clostridia bacterium]
MSDHEERKEAREERREERAEDREERKEERAEHREERKGEHGHHGHHGHHGGPGRHGRFVHDAEKFTVKSAHEEIAKVKDELDDILEKKEIHVHATHVWLHRLTHAAFKLLRTHEDELDEAKPEASWVPDALNSVFDAEKQSVALGKAIVSASGTHTAKEADFNKAEVQDALKGLQLDIDKAVQQIPDGE